MITDLLFVMALQADGDDRTRKFSEAGRADVDVDVEKTTEFICSSEVEARDGDVIDQASWQLAAYKRNPVVLNEHWGAVVGRSDRVWVEADKGQLRAIVAWDDGEQNPMGRLVAHQHRSGFRRAVSVRWRPGKITARNELPKEHRWYAEPVKRKGFFGEYFHVGRLHERSELLEISSVSIPSDPTALQVRGGAAHQMPDAGARSAMMAALDEAIRSDAGKATFVDELLTPWLRSAPGIELVRQVVLGHVRSDRELRAAVRAAVDLTPSARPAPLDGLAHLFPVEQ